MNIKEIRENKLKSYIIKRLIEEGIEPTDSLVCSMLASEFENIPMNGSLLSKKHNISRLEPASASKMNEIADYIEIDLDTLYESSDSFGKEISTAVSQSLARISNLEYELKKLETRIKALLSVGGNGNIDTKSVPLNTVSGNLLYNPATNTLGAGMTTSDNFYNSVNIIRSISATSLTSGHSGIYADDTAALVGNPNLIWKYRMLSPEKRDGATVSLKVSLKTPLECSQIRVLFGESTKYRFTVFGGYENEYSRIANTAEYSGIADITFPRKMYDSFVINIQSLTYTAGEYIFLLDELMIGNGEFLAESYGLITVNHPFYSLRLMAEEVIPDGCSVEYKVSWAGSDPVAIQNSMATPIDSSKIVDLYSGVSTILNDTVLDSAIANPYIYGNIFGLSAVVNVSKEELYKCNPRVIRYVGGAHVDPETNAGTIYFRTADVLDADFSSIPGVLDGIPVSSNTIVSSGIHKFQFSAATNLQGYLQEFAAMAEASASFRYGGGIAEYIPVQSFISLDNVSGRDKFTIADEYNYATLTPDTTKSRILLYNNQQNIQYLQPVSKEGCCLTYKNKSEVSDVSSFVLEIKMKSFNNTAPTIKKIDLILGRQA